MIVPVTNVESKERQIGLEGKLLNSASKRL